MKLRPLMVLSQTYRIWAGVHTHTHTHHTSSAHTQTSSQTWTYNKHIGHALHACVLLAGREERGRGKEVVFPSLCLSPPCATPPSPPPDTQS